MSARSQVLSAEVETDCSDGVQILPVARAYCDYVGTTPIRNPTRQTQSRPRRLPESRVAVFNIRRASLSVCCPTTMTEFRTKFLSKLRPPSRASRDNRGDQDPTINTRDARSRIRKLLSRSTRSSSPRVNESHPMIQSTSSAVASASQSSYPGIASLSQDDVAPSQDQLIASSSAASLDAVSEYAATSMPETERPPASTHIPSTISRSAPAASSDATTFARNFFKTTLVVLNDALTGLPIPGQGAITAMIRIITIAEVSSRTILEDPFLMLAMTYVENDV